MELVNLTRYTAERVNGMDGENRDSRIAHWPCFP